MSSMEWKKYKNDFMPKSRVGAGLSFNEEDDSLYLWGISEGSEKNESLAVYRFNLITEKWSVLETDYEENDIVEPRSFHGLAIYNNSMYVMYGSDLQSNIEFDNVLELDIQNGSWSIYEVAEKFRISMFATIPDEETYYIFCGGNSDEEFNSVYEINFHNRTFTRLFENTYVFERRHSYTLFRVGLDLLLFGGADHSTV